MLSRLRSGADLSKNNKNYEQYDPSGNDGNVNSLRGLDDCLVAMKNAGTTVKRLKSPISPYYNA